MRKVIRYILAYCLVCAVTSALDAIAPCYVGGAPGQAVGQEDEQDPFGEFGSDEDEDESDGLFGDEEDAEDAQEEASPFDSEPDATEPFAPSAISETNVDAEKEPAKAKSNPDDPRSQYARPEDVPDELKTEEDFFATLTPAERTILATTPQTDVEWYAAAARVARIGRVEFAKLLVEKASTAPAATAEATANALEQLTTGRAVYLVAHPGIGPVGETTYEKLLTRAQTYWEDDANLRAALDDLRSDVEQKRSSALVRLRRGGRTAIKALVAELLSGDEARSRVASDVFAFFEGDGTNALVACVREAPDAAVVALAPTLGDRADARVALELAIRYYDKASGSSRNALADELISLHGEVPALESVVADAYRNALGYYNRELVFYPVVDDAVELWTWNADSDNVDCASVPLAEAYRSEAARWALTAYRLSEGASDASGVKRATLQELALTAVAEREAYRVGLDSVDRGADAFVQEFPEIATVDLVRGVRYALATKHYNGALIPLAILAQSGDASLLATTDGSMSPIVQAATCASRRARYQALTAIVKWNPERSYIGSSRVVDALQWFSTSTGQKVVVVATPKLADATRLGQVFLTLGYRTIPATSGRDVLLAAQNNADVEFVYVNATVRNPDLSALAQALRADPRTADAPLLVGFDDDWEESLARSKVGAEPNVFVTPTPYDLETASWALQNLRERSGVEPVDADIRLVASVRSARALLALVTSRPNIYSLDNINELTSRYLSTPALFDVGLDFAGSIKTSYAQNRLVELIGDTRYDLATRRRALEAFERQLTTNGSLLRGPDVQKMYDRYNASEKEDENTQRVLSTMLDVYEKATER
ncbi:MAG: hypothetical protein IJU03_00885 [Thermoguttaceae bacterium]|nr:hypothetical protein [Thermoguttaceae bacterium]